MKFIRNYILALLVIVFSKPIFAQAFFGVSGTVYTDKNIPVKNAMLSFNLKNTSNFFNTQVSTNGYYTLPLSTGIYNVSVTAPNFITISTTVIVYDNINNLNFYLNTQLVSEGNMGEGLRFYTPYGWENLKDLALTDIFTAGATYLYMIGYTNPNHYVVRFSTDSNGNMVFDRISDVVESLGVNYKKAVFNSNGLKLFVSGPTGSGVWGYTQSLGLNNYLNLGTTDYISDVTTDGNNLYSCYTSGIIQKINADISSILLSSSNIGGCSKIVYSQNNIYIGKLETSYIYKRSATDFSLIDSTFTWPNAFQNFDVINSTITALRFAWNGNSWDLLITTYPANMISKGSKIFNFPMPYSSNPSIKDVKHYGNYMAVLSAVNNNTSTDNPYDSVVYLFDVSDISDIKLKSIYTYPQTTPYYVWLNDVDLFLSGLRNVNYNGTLNSDIILKSFRLPQIVSNTPPNLLWVNEFGYFNKGVDKNYGIETDPFNFKVLYNDLESDPTAYMRLKICSDNNCSNIIKNINLNLGGVSNVPSGMAGYSTSVFLAEGSYYYKFEAADISSNTAYGYPTEVNGPITVKKGFLGDMTSGIEFSNGSVIKAKKIKVNNDYIYSALESDGDIILVKYSTGANSQNKTARISEYYDSLKCQWNYDYCKPKLVGVDTDSSGYPYVVISKFESSLPNNELWDVVIYKYDKDLTAWISSQTYSKWFELASSSYTDRAYSMEYNAGDGKFYVFIGRDGIMRFDSNLSISTISWNMTSQKFVDLFNFIKGVEINSIKYFNNNSYIVASSTNGIFFGESKEVDGSYDIITDTTAPFYKPFSVSYYKNPKIAINNEWAYIGVTVNNGIKNSWMVIKSTIDVNDNNKIKFLDAVMYDGGTRGEFSDIKLDSLGNVYLVGQKDFGNDLSNQSVIVKYDRNLNMITDMVISTGYSKGIDFDFSSDWSNIYVLTQIESTLLTQTKSLLKRIINPGSDYNKNITINIKNKANNSNMNGVKVGLIAFNLKGEPDPSFAKISFTDSSGNANFKLKYGIPYFIAISTSRYGPTVKEQMSDPLQSFIKTFNSDATYYYRLGEISKSTNTITLTVKNIYPGAVITGEVILSKTNETVSFGIMKATDTVSTFNIDNVPNLSAIDYYINVSMPNWLNVSLTPAVPINKDLNFVVDFSTAVPPIKNVDQNINTTKQSLFTGYVFDTNGVPISNVKVTLYNQCSQTIPCKNVNLYTSENGRFDVYELDTLGESWWVRFSKLGYFYDEENGGSDNIVNNGVWIKNSYNYVMQKATYSLSGVITNFGKPIAYAKVVLRNDRCGWPGDDSYRDRCTASVFYETYLDGQGRFTFNGINDGNYFLSVETPFWKSINEGKVQNWESIDSDDIRISVSSSGAVSPSMPYANPCAPGRVWVLDSSGTCKGVMPYAFDVGDDSIVTDSKLYGNLILATTYTINASNPILISSQSPIIVLIEQDCNGPCQNNRKVFTSDPIYGSFNSNMIPYEINAVSTENGEKIKYSVKIVSDRWASISNFDNSVKFDYLNINKDLKLAPAGRFTVRLRKPDGSFFIPANEPLFPNGVEVNFKGINVDFQYSANLEWETGIFELANIPGGKYKMYINFKSTYVAYAPIEVGDIIVKPGSSTDLTADIKNGVFVKPQILGLPSLPSPKYEYSVIAVESGKKMNRDLLNELLFSEPKYSFEYDTTTANWPMMAMDEGLYDFYLIAYSHYEADDYFGENKNFDQFVYFIGRKKSFEVKKDDNNPLIGSSSQPLPVQITGSIGGKTVSGWTKGKDIFTAKDYERLFSQMDVNYIIPLIPSIMIYDSAGEIKAFAHSLPGGEVQFNNFMNYMISKDSASVLTQIEQGSFTYKVWGLGNGNYTAVITNPNYPIITKQIAVSSDIVYNINFDEEKIKTYDIYGVVKSSASQANIVNALVYIKGKTVEKNTYTNENGVFVFDKLPPGTYRIEVSRDGFVKTGKKINIDNKTLDLGTFYIAPTNTTISGRVLLSRFPQPKTKKGIKVYAYDETLNVTNPESYLPTIVSLTDDDGNFTLDGIIAGHNYRVVISEPAKMTYTSLISSSSIISSTDNNMGEIVLLDLPPQIQLIVRKNPDNEKKSQVVIKSPKELNSTPKCYYSPGTYFDETNSVSLALIPGTNNTYLGEFTISANQRYYTVRVEVGDVIKLQKDIIYDSQSKVKADQYAYEAGLIGGDIYVDEEREEYSGITFDAGALTQSTSSLSASYIKVMSSGGDEDLIGGFFKALPNVRTIKTAKGVMNISDAIKNIMASEVYTINLENAQPNKSFTLNLQYDKDKVIDPNGLRIYQYDETSGQWKEIKGNYNVDPMIGTVSVDVASIEKAYEDSKDTISPFGRKNLKMSGISPLGYYVPQSNSSSQTGQFAVFVSKPPTLTAYSGSSYEVYNLPNPFNLKNKTVTISSDGGAWYSGAYVTRGTVIKYFLPQGKSGSMKFVIYNMAGEKVRTLDEGVRTGGEIYYSEWDGKNDKNEDVASGVYLLVSFINGEKIGKPHKMAVIK